MIQLRKLVYSIPGSEALQEMILEGLRLAFCAAVSTFLTFLVSQVQELPNSEVYIMVLTLIIRLWDKYKYENKKELKVKVNTGLIGF